LFNNTFRNIWRRRDNVKRLELKFTNEEGKVVTYSIDNPIEPANPSKINAAMDEILKQNVFTTGGGDLTAKKSAMIVERVVEEIEMN
jgi:hypothetical protein